VKSSIHVAAAASSFVHSTYYYYISLPPPFARPHLVLSAEAAATITIMTKKQNDDGEGAGTKDKLYARRKLKKLLELSLFNFLLFLCSLLREHIFKRLRQHWHFAKRHRGMSRGERVIRARRKR
jgi:hypothetical protein